MASSNAAPEIVASFSQLLHCIRTPAAIHQVGLHVRTRHPQLLQQAIRSQKLIGVQGMLEGLLSTYWAELKTRHFQAQGSQRTGEVWLTKAATQLIWISFHMWQHRNGFQHSDNNTQLRSRKQDAHFGIREQFTLGVEDLPPLIKQMLRRPKKEVLRLSLTEQETRLRIVRNNERRRACRSLDYQRQILHRFLIQPIGPKPPRPKRTSTHTTVPRPALRQTVFVATDGSSLKQTIRRPSTPPHPPPTWKQRTLDGFLTI